MSPQGVIEEGKFQLVNGLHAISLPERYGKIEILLFPSVNYPNHAGGDHILDRFTNLLGNDRQVFVYRGSWGDGAWPPLTIKFKLEDGESFCDTAINLVEVIFERAGVEDESNYLLGNFTLKQDTFVKFENNWISFVRWLRLQHHLPLNCVGDEKNISLVGERDLV